MKRTLFDAEQIMFRDSFRTFLEREVAPHYQAWEQAGVVPRALWQKAGRQGFLGTDVPEALGGAGLRDYRYNTVIVEELFSGAKMGIGDGVSANDIVIPYLLRYATPEQQHRWLPRLASGERVGAIVRHDHFSRRQRLAGIRASAIRDWATATC
ncbi:MAG: acyl-CoA dehydrogenase family protein [Kouleothrix sp.]